MDGYNLTTLMKRLEAATSRLEDLLVVGQNQDSSQWVASPASSQQTLERAAVEAAPAAAPAAAKAKSSAIATPVVPPTVAPAASAIPVSLDALDAKLDALVGLSQGIDPVLAEQVLRLKSASAAANEVVIIASQAKKAEMGSPEYMALLKPLSDSIAAVAEIREANRSNPAANHLATIAEGVPALGWVSTDAPADYVQDFKDSAQFYSNRVLKDNKDHGEWVKTFLGYLNDLKAAVKQDFPKGLSWSASGRPLKEVLATPASIPASADLRGASPSAGGPPPPAPPPPSVESLTAAASKAPKAPAASGMAGVLADLNKGSAVTAGLRHVDRSKKEAPKAPPKPGSLKKAKPAPAAAAPAPARKPRTELENNRWIIENYVDEHEIVVDAELSQAILIDSCKECTIQIKGKATSVTITKCTKTGVLVDTLVSGVEIINSSNFGLQITGTVASLTIDNSHDGSVYLSESALEIEIYTSQTAAINVNIPTGEPGDYIEKPLPEQIVHKVVDKKIASTAVNAAEK